MAGAVLSVTISRRLAPKLLCLLSAFWLGVFATSHTTTAHPIPVDSLSGEDHSSSHHQHTMSLGRESASAKLPPSGLSPEEDLEYSRFMHHSSGVTVLVIGMLLLIDRLTTRRHRLMRVACGLTWLMFGTFLFVFSDLEAWPIGPAGFIESFSLPTADEWIQHHLLAMIPMVFGIYMMFSRWKESRPLWGYVAATIAMLGGTALLIHQHWDHPGMDFVNIQHRLFALTTFFIAGSLAAEDSASVKWRAKPYLLPAALLLLGIQLALYVE